MKIVKRLIIFSLSTLLLDSCFTPPEFPTVPEIAFEGVEFVDAQTDSLIVYIHFRDGDGDLGLNNEDLNYISYPYHNAFFFQTTSTGGLDTLFTFAASSQTKQYDILEISNPGQGKLVFPRTRKTPGYGFLPAFNCVDYEYLVARNLLVEAGDIAALDDDVRIIDTLRSVSTDYYHILDTLYLKTNPDHYNIEIDFLVKEGQDFVEFDWRQEFCTQSYDGRFPVLVENPGALEGTLRYAMVSVGFMNIFSIKTLKLRIQIKDRALHQSNVVFTPEFTLDKIRKK